MLPYILLCDHCKVPLTAIGQGVPAYCLTVGCPSYAFPEPELPFALLAAGYPDEERRGWMVRQLERLRDAHGRSD